MDAQFFTYNESTLHFLKSGSGPNILLAFHGFGQDQKVFENLSLQLNDHYTLFTFDLFFHGKSTWGMGEAPLEKTFWKSLLAGFLIQNRIDRFSLLGFSLGGKFALASLEAFPEKVDSIFLFAPDGIKTNAWYRLATYPVVLRKLFKSMITKPWRFHQLVKLAFTIGLIDKSLLRFVELQMNTEAKRMQVYLSWVVFRHMQFNMTRVADLINSNHIALTVVVGRYDKIITVNNMKCLLKNVKHYTLHTPETGHTGILSKIDQVVISSFQNGIHAESKT